MHKRGISQLLGIFDYISIAYYNWKGNAEIILHSAVFSVTFIGSLDRAITVCILWGKNLNLHDYNKNNKSRLLIKYIVFIILFRRIIVT